MAIGPASKKPNPLQSKLEALQAEHHHYHIVLWYSDSMEPLSMTIEIWAKVTTFDFESKQPEFSASSWMSHLCDDLNLKDLTLPGTRCSSAFANWVTDTGDIEVEPEIKDQKLKSRILAMYKYQKAGILAQLNSGVRLLDLRCDASRKLRHGPLTLDKHLDSALDQVRKFLADNPSEAVVILLSFSSAAAGYDASKPWSEGYSVNVDDVPGNFNKQVMRDMRNDKVLYTGTEWPLLGNVRGQAVIFRGWDLDPSEDKWALDCRLPLWESARGSPEFAQASDLAAQRWTEIAGDFSRQRSLKSIILATSLSHDPENDASWIPPLQTAPILQKKTEEHIKQCVNQLKRLWVYGDGMEERTNMAIAKLNFWGSDDEGALRPLPVNFMKKTVTEDRLKDK
ncbi:PLC-like phosphodiesterase [Colletotrichum falcatum]|nr:PLC-like phosphodiesterase [Colletotrichum falcatum]